MQPFQRSLLQHKTREAIFVFVRGNPGLHLREIQRRMGVPLTTLDYHVYLLCRCGLVYKMRDGKYCRYYSGEVDERTHLCVSALRKPRKKEILSVVLSGGLISYRELSCMVGVRQSTLSHHIGELVADGILRRVRVGKEFYYTPVDRCHLAGVFNGLKGDALK